MKQKFWCFTDNRKTGENTREFFFIGTVDQCLRFCASLVLYETDVYFKFIEW